MSVFYKITIPVVVALGALSIFFTVFVSASLQNALVREEFLRVEDAVAKNQAQVLAAADFTGAEGPQAADHFQAFYDRIVDPSIARLTIWDSNENAVYSDLPYIVGKHFNGTDDVTKALSTGTPFFLVRSTDPTTPPQTDFGKNQFIDIFIPLRIEGKVVAVAEVRAVIASVLKPIQAEINNVSVDLVAASVFIFIIVLVAFRLFVLRPLAGLKDVSTRVIGGDLGARVKATVAKDEFGEVTSFVNQMLTRVQASQDELKRANALITKQKEGVEEEVRMRTQELTEEKARLIASLNSLSLGFLLTARYDTLIYANPAVGALFGTGTAPVEVHDIDEALKGAMDFAAERKRVMEERKSCELKEVAYGTKFLRVLIAPIVVAQSDAVIGTATVFEDITEARLLDYAKTSFVAIASHELRTPLTIIRGNAELILDDIKGKDEAGIEPRVKSIYEGSIRLLNIVNDFLDVTALEEKHVEFKKEPFNLVELVQGVANDLHDRAGKKGLTIEVAVPDPAAPNVLADRERSKEVFVNMIANAIQYTEHGSVTVTFESKEGKLKASITDTGVGIPEERKQSLFKKFNTVQDKFLRSREYGSGMGLYISKLIVDAMGGAIALERSELGKGSTFSVSFPLA